MSNGVRPYRRTAVPSESTSARCTQPSSSGSDASYGLPSGVRPRTAACARRTRATASAACADVPNVVTVTNAAVRCSRSGGSSR
jgi:hypothetical protein